MMLPQSAQQPATSVLPVPLPAPWPRVSRWPKTYPRTEAQSALGSNREDQLLRNQARIAEIKAAMEPLVEFGKTCDEGLLAGLAEFESLIAARRNLEALEQATA